MATYEELPCSIYLNAKKDSEPRKENLSIKSLPKALVPENTEVLKATNKLAESSENPININRKSCLTSSTANKNHHQQHQKQHLPHSALRKKTVAFGRTVNVSQTVEATSRASKNRNGKKMSDEKKVENTENQMEKENIEQADLAVLKELVRDFLKQMNQQSEDIKEIKKVINGTKEVEARSDDNLNNFHETTNKFKTQESNRQILKKEGKLSPEAILIVEKRLKVDPIFRQQIDDVLADAEYETHRRAYSPIPSPEFRRQNDFTCHNGIRSVGAGSNSVGAGALMRETLTVERSIHVDNPISIDSSSWLNNGKNGKPASSGGWRTVQNDGLHSTYQPGNSISYYPTSFEPQNTRNAGYYVEHASDHDEEQGVNLNKSETLAEKERKIREKYSRRNRQLS